MGIVFENNIIKMEPLSFDENLGGLGTIFFEHMKKHGNNVAQIEAETEKSDSYSSLLRKCVRAAMAMGKRGIKKGDFVAMCTDHHLDASVAFLAAQFIGAITYSLEPSLTVEDCINLIKQVRADIIFVIKSCEEKIRTCFELTNIQAEIIVFGEEFQRDFLLPQREEDNFQPRHIGDMCETAIIYFSSGTTGLPKPVCVTHYCMTTACDQLTNYGTCFLFGKCSKNAVFLSYSNWHWFSSCWILLCCLVKGACRILSNEFDTLKFWNYVDKYKITSVYLSPLKSIEVCESEIPASVDYSSLLSLSYSGSPLSLEYVLKLRKQLPNTLSYQCYGQTEVGIITRIPNLEDEAQLRYYRQKPTTIGMPLKGMWYKVVDPDTDQPLGFYQNGELRVKTKQVMNGYYNRDSTTSFDEDGYYKTGDMVYYDDDFCFFFVQRLKELLKYREWHVFPVMLENILQQHPAVKNAVVIGKPHKVDGDHPMGIVVLKENYDISEDALVKFVNDKVEERQKIRGGIKFVKSFPLGPTGKISRLALKELI